MKRRAIALAALGVAVIAVLGLRVVLEGRAALARGDAALAAKQPIVAIAAWEAAARWYLPGAPHVDEAYDRLVELARTAPAVELIAWRAVRSAALATRHVTTPHGDDLALANREIARLAAKDPEGSPLAGSDAAAREQWHLQRLGPDPRPSTAATVLCCFGIVCWLGGIGHLVFRGVGASGEWVRRQGLVGIALAVVGLAGWAAGLYNA